MRQSAKVEGTKIAQAAKDLNVTSVTIRRYLTEFNIETTSDENGIKVLPIAAMEELQEIRKLKEDGLTNPKVMELLEERRSNRKAPDKGAKVKEKAKAKAEPVSRSKSKESQDVAAAPLEDEEPAPKADKKKPSRRMAKIEEQEEEGEPVAAAAAATDEEEEGAEEAAPAEGRSKHSLTCQTCGKVFEHMNPRLRDCLDCYRAKRKERRRGGSERHKNVIQHPLAQQAANNKTTQPAALPPLPQQEEHVVAVAAPVRQMPQPVSFAPQVQRAPVRNYRKAIEETRQITGSLKRRLERPDLPEGERRWLEQIYAYQLILHQGWRHLAEYKATSQQQGRSAED